MKICTWFPLNDILAHVLLELRTRLLYTERSGMSSSVSDDYTCVRRAAHSWVRFDTHKLTQGTSCLPCRAAILVHARSHLFASRNTHLCTRSHTCTHIDMPTSTWTYLYTCMHTRLYTLSGHMYTYTCTDTCTNVCTHLCTNMFTCRYPFVDM